MAGYLTPDAGAITIDGLPVTEDSIEPRRRIGYLPENAPLPSDLEVTEYLSYIAHLRGIPAGARTARIRDMVETCGLAAVVGRAIGKLSKGYKQRVGLAASMIHTPTILILDEPTSGLDPNQILEIRDLIREIGRKRTVVLSTHILQEVEATCSRALIINAGKLVGHGTIEELRRRAGGAATYTIALRAARPAIEEKLRALSGVTVREWLSEETTERQRVVLADDDSSDHSEELFRWAVENGFALSELSRESATLEEVFRELTRP
jgi:ABC-2 type transport system ATP-binding protein